MVNIVYVRQIVGAWILTLIASTQFSVRAIYNRRTSNQLATNSLLQKHPIPHLYPIHLY